MVELEFISMRSLVGTLSIGAGRDGIAVVRSQGRGKVGGPGPSRYGRTLQKARRELEQYLSGRRRRFTLELDLSSGTRFQQRVWNELLKVPFGEVVTYGEIGRRIGKRGAARAVGQANGANPIAVMVPCHRVIASGNRLGGYGGGLDMKRALLGLEGVVLD